MCQSNMFLKSNYLKIIASLLEKCHMGFEIQLFVVYTVLLFNRQ